MRAKKKNLFVHSACDDRNVQKRAIAQLDHRHQFDHRAICAVGSMLLANLRVSGLSVIALYRFTEAGVRDWQRGQL